MVRHDVAVVCELGAADTAVTRLGDDLSIEQFSHLSIRPKFAIPSRMKWIFDSADAELTHCLRFRNYFPSAAETRTMDWADLVAIKSHNFSPECH
jgi:hypothetical protein